MLLGSCAFYLPASDLLVFRARSKREIHIREKPVHVHSGLTRCRNGCGNQGLSVHVEYMRWQYIQDDVLSTHPSFTR